MDLPFYSRRIKSLQRQSLVIEIAKLIIENYYYGCYQFWLKMMMNVF
jgi:hypothetical protein